MSKKIKINVLVYVHSIPEWLTPHLQQSNSDYYIWAKDYERLKEGKNLWRVWMIDENSNYWLEINYMNENELPQFNTLKLEPNTYSLVKIDSYEVFSG